MTTPTPTPDALAASSRAFALQCKPLGVSGVLNEAADLIQQQQADIERLSAEKAELRRIIAELGYCTLDFMAEARAALGKDEKE